MSNINQLIKYISEQNAPQFIYNILYKKEPHFLMGRTVSHQQQLINNISIDKDIPKEAITKLFSIKDIIPRSSCQGESDDKPTFFIFRTINQDEEYIKLVVKKLNSYSNIVAGYGLGNRGNYRIGVTAKLYYDEDPKKFKEWWIHLPNIIEKSL